YEQVARAVDRIIAGKPPSAEDRSLFAQRSERIRRYSEELATGIEAARAPLIDALLDEFGIGRVMFRNTRAALTGFPERKARLIPLDAAPDELTAKIKWLVALLKELAAEKVLLICRTRELAETIHARLLREINVNAALFHEALTLLQRDRNAAFFAEEDGARILICSEIGSEGRNFQFAHHLVLFDLPGDPELLEQRIGRLDRIGQTATIRIHVPFGRGGESEVLARWYHEGLNAFEKHPHGAPELARELGGELAALRENFDATKLAAFIAKTRKRNAALTKKLERGHDRLLELNSCRAEPAAETIAQIRAEDADETFETFCTDMFDFFGVHVEELARRTYLLRAGHLRTDAFPALPEAGMSATFDRTRALGREDLGFLSEDHPVVRGALDLLLGGESGNAAFAVWKSGSRESVLLEIFAVVECVAPPALHADRFLPATPVRVVVDHALADLTDDAELDAAKLEAGDIFRLLDRGAVKKKLIPAMLEKALALATERRDAFVTAASSRMDAQLRDEIERLEDLRQINDHVRPEELAAARQQRESLRDALAASPLRLDALRLILQMP
ncbi:MAG TPA: helicase-related protein, partial [Chthoniobacteraceae bacterium]|nr:helicase-related protein [Chthoniobacteraceae bacterium]